MTWNFFFLQDDGGNLCKLYLLFKSQALTSSTEDKATNWHKGKWWKCFLVIKSPGICKFPENCVIEGSRGRGGKSKQQIGSRKVSEGRRSETAHREVGLERGRGRKITQSHLFLFFVSCRTIPCALWIWYYYGTAGDINRNNFQPAKSVLEGEKLECAAFAKSTLYSHQCVTTGVTPVSSGTERKHAV